MAGEYGSAVNLPPGFRFGPTDQELILHFLLPKARHVRCYPDIIPDLGYSLPHPWQLHGKALWSENRYYFFRRVMKDDDDDDETEISGRTAAGIWKEVEEDHHHQAIFGGGDHMHVIGLKKLLVYYCSEFDDDDDDDHQTNWFMQQYYLHQYSNSTPPGDHHIKPAASHDDHQYNHLDHLDYCKWTLCRVEERKGRLHQSSSYYNDEEDNGSQLSCLDEMYLELDDDDDDSNVTFST